MVLPAVTAPIARRTLLGAAAATLARPSVARAQGTARIVVVGAGAAGSTAAQALARAGHQVTLVEAEQSYVAAPGSNEVLVGLRDYADQQCGWGAATAAGARLVHGRVTLVDPAARRIDGDAGRLEYDRLVIAPGIDVLLDGAIPGYDQAASARMPHAWKPGIQTILLREQLREMPDGGTFVLSIPPAPFRYPLAAYGRASLVAWLLKKEKPRSKVLVLDGNDRFPAQSVIQQSWAELFPGLLEWVPAAKGGRVTAVDAGAMTLTAGGQLHKADVASVIPPQGAGTLAQIAGAVDRTGWCPVDPATFESRRVPRIHVLGDALAPGTLPMSAFSAVNGARACAEAITAILAGRAPARQKLIDTSFALLRPGDAVSTVSVMALAGGQWTPIEGAGGPTDPITPREARAREADAYFAWLDVFKATIFG